MVTFAICWIVLLRFSACTLRMVWGLLLTCKRVGHTRYFTEHFSHRNCIKDSLLVPLLAKSMKSLSHPEYFTAIFSYCVGILIVSTFFLSFLFLQKVREVTQFPFTVFTQHSIVVNVCAQALTASRCSAAQYSSKCMCPGINSFKVLSSTV